MKLAHLIGAALAATAMCGALTVVAHAGPTLDAVKARGTLRCGAMLDVPGFGYVDKNGTPQGFEIDHCRALAAGVFGDAKKVEIVPLSHNTRFPALQSGEVDVLFRQTTVTFNRDTTLGFLFGPVSIYDGQGVMVPAKLGIKKLSELDGAAVCVVPNSNSELTIGDFFRANKLTFRPVSIENHDEIRKAFFAGRCDVFTADRAFLASIRSVAPNPDDYVILDETVAKSPISPIVRQGDDQWYNIVRWVTYAPQIAEELGLDSSNIKSGVNAETNNPQLRRFLGQEKGSGKGIGLSDDWAVNIVSQVGNYAEIYDRSIGLKSPLKLPRGQSELYTKGGLIYPPPFL